jgi:hypothetical protein
VCWRRSRHQTSEDELLAVLSTTGSDTRDLGTGVAPSLHTSGWSAPGAPTFRDGAEGRLLRSRPRSHLPGGTPSGRRDPRGVSWRWQATQDASSRRRGKERCRFKVEEG